MPYGFNALEIEIGFSYRLCFQSTLHHEKKSAHILMLTVNEHDIHNLDDKNWMLNLDLHTCTIYLIIHKLV